MSARTADAVDLVVNEAVTNVINHARHDDAFHQVLIAWRTADDSIVIEDDGQTFNPLVAPALLVGAGLEHPSVVGAFT